MLNFKELVGKEITIQGKIAVEIWQHPIGPSSEYPIDTYFDVEGEAQIVVYSKNEMGPPGSKLSLTGKVIELSALSKNPMGREEYKVYHFCADSWETLPSD
jgi:hypothetical protein